MFQEGIAFSLEPWLTTAHLADMASDQTLGSDRALRPHDAPPKWLSRLTLTSIGLAMLAFATLLWAKWGVVLAMSQDVLRFCF